MGVSYRSGGSPRALGQRGVCAQPFFFLPLFGVKPETVADVGEEASKNTLSSPPPDRIPVTELIWWAADVRSGAQFPVRKGQPGPWVKSGWNVALQAVE